MNAENFSRFLTSYAQLYHLSYVELESLVLEYPYSQNLHLLLFAKSWLEQHPQADANLRTAALYSTDRRVLYTFMQELSKHLAAPSIQFSMQEDYLELTELPRLPKLQELRSSPGARQGCRPGKTLPAFSPRRTGGGAPFQTFR